MVTNSALSGPPHLTTRCRLRLRRRAAGCRRDCSLKEREDYARRGQPQQCRQNRCLEQVPGTRIRHAKVMRGAAADCSLPWVVSPEIPEMTLEIPATEAAAAVFLVLDVDHDLGAGGFRARVNHVGVSGALR